MTDHAPVPGSYHGPLHDLAVSLRDSPDRVLMKWAEGTMTVSEFDVMARAFAAQLRATGVKKGDRVALMGGNTHKLIAATYGIWMLGAVEVSVNSELKGALLKHVLDDSDPSLLLCDAQLLELVAAERPGLMAVALELLGEATDEPAVDPIEMPEGETLASLLYTSGTTGASKGVMIPHGYYSYFAHTLGSVVGLTNDDTCYFTLPFFHVDAHIAVPACLRFGSTFAFTERFSVSRFWPDFIRFGGTWFGAVGAMLSALITQGRPPQSALDQLRVIVAAPIPQEAFDSFEDEWGVPLLQMYGQTEANGPLYSTFERNRRGAMGAPVAGFEIKVVDHSGNDLPAGQPGEMLTKPILPNARTLGYWRRPEADTAAFTDGWFHTGDIVRRDEDDFVWYLGRKNDSLRRRGENISAFELEKVLLNAPAVMIAAVLGVRDELGGEDEVKAVLVVEESFDYTVFADYCRAELPRYAIPRFVELVDETQIVRGPGTGAIQKHLLPQGITPATYEVEHKLLERKNK